MGDGLRTFQVLLPLEQTEFLYRARQTRQNFNAVWTGFQTLVQMGVAERWQPRFIRTVSAGGRRLISSTLKMAKKAVEIETGGRQALPDGHCRDSALGFLTISARCGSLNTM